MNIENYYGIIPMNVRHSLELNAEDKLVYCGITTYLDKNAVCIITDEQLASSIGLTQKKVRQSINKLMQNNFIKLQNQQFIEKNILFEITLNNQ